MLDALLKPASPAVTSLIPLFKSPPLPIDKGLYKLFVLFDGVSIGAVKNPDGTADKATVWGVVSPVSGASPKS